ncbi:hypothetical protein OT109_12515 [Phycisphaeraceae bacterium D3-23]
MDTKTLKKKTATPSATRAVSPDDLRRGDYVAVMHTTEQFVVRNDKSWGGELKVVSAKLFPYESGETFRVRAVCLPFVFTRVASGGYRTLDLRSHHLRRLDKAFGKLAFHAQRDKTADKKPGKGKKSCRKNRKGKKKGK